MPSRKNICGDCSKPLHSDGKTNWAQSLIIDSAGSFRQTYRFVKWVHLVCPDDEDDDEESAGQAV